MNLLALVEAPDHVCCRYRIRAFARALEAAGCLLTYESLASGALGRAAQFRHASRFDGVILQRKLLPGWQLALLRSSARRLIFDFDDAVLHRDSYDRRGINSRRRLARFSATVRGCDAVIAGNDFLADCALRCGASLDCVRVIPTCVALEGYDVSRRGREVWGADCDLVWIGSSSTLKGLEESRPIWSAIAKAVPGVRIRIICDRFPEDFPIPVVRVAWEERTEAEELGRSHIGVGWLPDDDWSRGKCGLKILQYQAAGLPVIANPVGVHREMVVHGETGFLCNEPGEWTEAVMALASSQSLRFQMGLRARRGVELRYSVEAWASAFVAAILGTGPIAGSMTPGSGRPHKMMGATTHDLEPIGH